MNTRDSESFPVVGIGASAGGLAAFEAFFSGMPPNVDPGMAFVLVQHLAPDHKSILAELVRKYTRMEVFEVEDGMVVRPNCAYIIPPNRDMAFLNGALQLLDPGAPRGQRLPIDFFFRSLAQDQHEHAICIILSGTGSDGTQGLRAIKGEGGMVMAQKPESADYDGMPSSAIATGMVDFELPPEKMPAQIIAYVAHAFGRQPQTVKGPAPQTENALKKIFVLLRAQTGRDFSQYKPNTIRRRIERRMAVQQIETIDDYVKYLQRTPLEVVALYRDMLIGVTQFFRDTEAFKELEDQVIPKLFEGKPTGSFIRVWSTGCSTGEEAYSIAILLQEHIEAHKLNFKVQVFATDIDSQAIATARAGIYPASISADISPQRLARYFAAEPDGNVYRISKSIRDTLVFSEQDLIKDPPFSKLDLISCRNLMIYLNADLQKKIIPLFHYALNPNGILFLGTSETVGSFDDLFISIDRKAKMFQKKSGSDGVRLKTPSQILQPIIAIESPLPRSAIKTAVSAKVPLREVAEQALLQQVVPAGALVNDQGDILYLHGRTGMYLEPAPGEAGINNILAMSREGLRRDLTTALHKAATSKAVVRHPGVRVKTNGDFTAVNVTVSPVTATPGLIEQAGSFATAESMLFLVIFEDGTTLDPGQATQVAAADKPTAVADGASTSTELNTDSRIEALKRELRAKEEYLHATNEELETSNEELKSSNEEMQSVNEELQSTNEELETSKEELQSLNEELATVNNELQNKVSDLSRINNDMNNLLAGTGIGTVFVDYQLRILRFTPAATRIINLIGADVGRPVGHIVSNLVGYSALIADVQIVLDTLIFKEVEVQTKEGSWYTMRILPYRTLDNVIEGAVITFVDISEMKKVREELQLNAARIRVALNASSIEIYNQDKDLRYTWIRNPHRGFPLEQIIGKTDADLFSTEDASSLTAIKKQAMESGKGSRQEVKTTIDGKHYVEDLTVEPLYDTLGTIIGVTCASMDITDRSTRNEIA